MTEKEKKWMFDLFNAIVNIENFIEKSSFEDYLKDFKTQSAVKRQLGIIGGPFKT